MNSSVKFLMIIGTIAWIAALAWYLNKEDQSLGDVVRAIAPMRDAGPTSRIESASGLLVGLETPSAKRGGRKRLDALEVSDVEGVRYRCRAIRGRGIVCSPCKRQQCESEASEATVSRETAPFAGRTPRGSDSDE